MQTLNDIEINLMPPVNPAQSQRIVGVDLSSVLNASVYAVTEKFDSDWAAFGPIQIDKVSANQLLIPINADITLSNIQDNLSITYYAKTIAPGGEDVTGRVIFKGQDFNIYAAPITFNLDSCCLPSKIVIDISKYNQDIPVDVVSIGTGTSGAATTTIVDNTSSDYNNDFGNDFGGDIKKRVLYLLNTDFWNAHEARDQFPYTIAYKGKTATNLITIQKIHN